MSVDAMLDFRIAISKIFKYEKTPLMRDAEHWIRGLSVGYTYYNTSRLTTLWVRQLVLQDGFARVDTVYGTSIDPRVLNYMNTGPGMIWYRGAGDESHWWGPELTISNLLSMPNSQKLGVMTPLTCGLGDFGTECFGETWIRMGYTPDSLKGGPAFFGVSDHFTHTKWNNPIMVGYFDGVFELDIEHFAAAAVAGKLQMFRTFPGNPSGYVQQYFNTYNMLGDPELELRTAIPKRIVVQHPANIPMGTGYIRAHVADTLGNPIEGAIVTIIKGHSPSEDVFRVDKSDADGYVEFTFETSTPDTIVITVSGKNLIPYQSNILMYQPGVTVGFDSLYVDGGDNILSPNETVQLAVVLRNFGTLQATGVRAILQTLDTNLVSISDAAHYYGTIEAGGTGNSTPFNFFIKPTATNGAVARVRIESSDPYYDMWESGFDITVSAPKLNIIATAFPGGNGRLDPGDSCNVTLSIKNIGALPALGVTATLRSDDPYVTIVTPDASFGDIAVGGTNTNSSPLVIKCSSDAYNGRQVNLTLHTITSNGMEENIPFSATVGVVAASDPMGPDRYGYYIYDNTDVANALHPTYGWVEIVPGLGGSGARINFTDTDDKSVLVTLPFSFVYYGKPYTRIIVCTNGFISPDTSRMDMAGNYWANFFNWPIPDPGNAKAQISPFWDDLQISSSGNLGVFAWNDIANHRYVIEWSGATHRNTSATETFEIIIYDPSYYPNVTGDAEMLFQYSTITNNDAEENYCSVGLESMDELDGIQYTFDNINSPGAAPVANGRAIKITTNNNRGGIKGVADLLDTDIDSGVNITVSNGSHTVSASNGAYLVRDLVPGSYDVDAEKIGYFPGATSGVEVTANMSAQGINFALNPCPVPTNLTASHGLLHRVELGWIGVSHENFIGYDIYRSLWQNSEYVKLNTDPVLVTNYTDNTVPDSSIYWYYVTAKYSSAEWTAESKPSNKESGTAGVPPGAMQGRVTEIDGTTPIEGVLIRALNGAAEIRRDTTDASGNYFLPSLPVIQVNLEASKDTYNTRTQYSIQVISDDTIAVNLNLSPEGANCDYVVGDANGSNTLNGLDVTYSVSYFKGGAAPTYTCECTVGHTWYVTGDVNGSCSFNGLDVTYMVSYFKGGPLVHPCPDCPPGTILAPLSPRLMPSVSPILNNQPEVGGTE